MSSAVPATSISQLDKCSNLQSDSFLWPRSPTALFSEAQLAMASTSLGTALTPRDLRCPVYPDSPASGLPRPPPSWTPELQAPGLLTEPRTHRAPADLGIRCSFDWDLCSLRSSLHAHPPSLGSKVTSSETRGRPPPLPPSPSPEGTLVPMGALRIHSLLLFKCGNTHASRCFTLCFTPAGTVVPGSELMLHTFFFPFFVD